MSKQKKMSKGEIGNRMKVITHSSDCIGDRMKAYEKTDRIKFKPKTPILVRVDGKAFHTYTKGAEKPFDDDLIEAMNQTAMYLLHNVDGAYLAYVQSDEISLLLLDDIKDSTQQWFGGNKSKIESITASYATGSLNRTNFATLKEFDSVIKNERNGINTMFLSIANFDSCSWQMPKEDVANYFYWRFLDAKRNAISMIASSLFSHKQLQGKSTQDRRDMIAEAGVNISDFTDGKLYGRLYSKNHKYESGEYINMAHEDLDYYYVNELIGEFYGR